MRVRARRAPPAAFMTVGGGCAEDVTYVAPKPPSTSRSKVLHNHARRDGPLCSRDSVQLSVARRYRLLRFLVTLCCSLKFLVGATPAAVDNTVRFLLGTTPAAADNTLRLLLGTSPAAADHKRRRRRQAATSSCWEADGSGAHAGAIRPAMHIKRIMLHRQANQSWTDALDDESELSRPSPRLATFLGQRLPPATLAAVSSRLRAHAALDRNVTAKRRVLVFDVHVNIGHPDMRSAFVHDGSTHARGSILVGRDNELPHAARQIGIELVALVFLPRDLMQPSIERLSPRVARGLRALRKQYASVLICPAAMLSALETDACRAPETRRCRTQSTRKLAQALRFATKRSDQYDGVLAWSGFQIGHADRLATELGVPISRRYQARMHRPCPNYQNYLSFPSHRSAL